MTEDLPGRIKYWLAEAKHDCFFLVGPENGPIERIGAIKHILMGDSEPFRAMLQDSALAEKGDIRVIDIDPETFKNFLKCVYGASSIIIPKLTFEEGAKLLYVIEKYLVDDITTELTGHMKNLLSPENIFVALSHPICYETESLEKEMFQILKYHFGKITKDDKFLELTHTAIEWILQVPYLTVREIEIWNAVLRWAKHKTGSCDGTTLRSYIFGLLKYIRFLTMDYTEFREGVVSSEILLRKDVYEICRGFVFGNMLGSIQHLCRNRSNRFNKFALRVCKRVVTSFLEFPQYAFVRCSVSSISDLQPDRQCSDSYHWAGYLWHLEIKKFNSEENTCCTHYLSVCVGCSSKTPNYSCDVNIEVCLINQIGKADECDDYSTTFCPSVPSSGYSSFLKWNALLNPENGFVKDDTIILAIKINLKNT